MVDFTAFWSGPFSTVWLCSMGADVIKVESVQRPDGLRFSAMVRPKVDPRFYEMSALWHATNLGKRGITLDLGDPRGLALAKRLIATADVVTENFTPSVMEGFGLSYDDVRAINPSAVMMRLPAFGLDGPWRDRGGFAQTMEQITGMAWQTGYDDGPPIIPGGVVDPMVGTHTALALVAALEHRDRTGEGQLVEMPMIEVAAAVTAEQVIDASIGRPDPGRRGAHGVYRCAGDDRWVAVDEASDPLDADCARGVVRGTNRGGRRGRAARRGDPGGRSGPRLRGARRPAARRPGVLPAARPRRRRPAGVPELADAAVRRSRRRLARARRRRWSDTDAVLRDPRGVRRGARHAAAPST